MKSEIQKLFELGIWKFVGILALGVGISYLCGCGYAIGNAYEVKSVDVPIFDNESMRRTNEFELTEVITRQLQSLGIRVNSSAEYVLKGKIVNYDTPLVFADKLDNPVVKAVSVDVHVKLENKKTGAIVWEETKRELAYNLLTRGENEDAARAQVYDRLARWVAMKMEKW